MTTVSKADMATTTAVQTEIEGVLENFLVAIARG
jgi:hypothetical protein